MNFALASSFDILARTPAVLDALLKNLPDDWIRATEGPDTWSPYDIVGHLIHGEQTDWIPRLRIILSEKEERKFTPFDRFAQFKESEGKTLQQLLDEFRSVRQKNLEILRETKLTDADLARTGVHPSLGTVTLSELLATWVVHDLDHIAQIVRVLAKRYATDVGPWKEYLKILRQS